MPARFEDREPPWPAVDWLDLIARAGLDVSSLETVTPKLTFRGPSDERLAWTAAYPGQADTPIHIEARAFHGRPVYFAVYPPWVDTEATAVAASSAANIIGSVITAVFALFVIVGTIVLARRNVRLQRGDRKGARLVVMALVVSSLIWWLLRAHYAPGLASMGVVIYILAGVALGGFIIWMVYMALEPHVRRLWPEALDLLVAADGGPRSRSTSRPGHSRRRCGLRRDHDVRVPVPTRAGLARHRRGSSGLAESRCAQRNPADGQSLLR